MSGGGDFFIFLVDVRMVWCGVDLVFRLLQVEF